MGIGTRSAGMISKLARGCSDTIVVITKGEDSAKTSQLMKLLSMGIKQGDDVTVTADGAAEDKAIFALRMFFEKNL